MSRQLNRRMIGTRIAKSGMTVIFAAVLSACANYAGISSDKQLATPDTYATQQSIPADSGQWPAVDWADQFGDAQLKALLEKGLISSTEFDSAKAEVLKKLIG